MSDEKRLAIYQSADGAIELPVDAKLEMIWASQKQTRRQRQDGRAGVVDARCG